MESDERAELASSPHENVSLEALPLHSTNLLTVLDEDGIIRYESPSIERIYGYEQDELVGEQVAEYVHPDDRERVIAAFQAVVAGDESTVESVEFRHEQADGTYVWVESVASGNSTPDGGYVVNTRDIADRKRREQELERQNERLDEFVGVVSHDLRNPLTVASGRLELVADECESDHLEAVERAHHRMETLIEHLLTLAREGDLVSDTAVVDLEALALNCWRHVETGSATIVTDGDGRIRADETRLQQLLENLMQNSVEHGSTSSRTQSGDAVERDGADVTVTVGMLDDGFYVEDDGAGIPPDDRDRVFEAGYSTERGGTGFGLSIVKRVVEAHGWDVRVTEGTDGGTRFEITGVECVR
ncbi:PAS domain S-box protein [Halorubrum sp. CBA1125]|uniref:sensor histidine kinase n=1 Tax=Halorubrum sp. CBA1125 TaxID=2668072 RepID=UPI0012E90C52|nr:PAS domain-containing sensor histidine kinase [Halorubrum sp. CBA1125]MUW15454.1 PAS domain S-box protein [Halorubrum sp. CBA1125]